MDENSELLFSSIFSNFSVLTIRLKPKDGDRCVSLIHIEKGKGNPASPTFRNKGTYLNDDDKLDKMKEYNMDLKEALQSVIDCNGGDFDFSDASKTDWDGAYPPCALPIKLEKDSD